MRLVGLEPTTPKLKVSCATNCATVAYFPSLRPHALSRDRRCLWSTNLYSGWASYTARLLPRFLSLSASAESDLIHRLVGRVCFSQLRYSVKTVRPLVVSVPSQHLYYNTLDLICQEVFTKLSNKCAYRWCVPRHGSCRNPTNHEWYRKP